MESYSSFCLQSGHTHKVTQLQLGSWTPEGLCTSPKTIVDVADLLFAVQRRSGNKSVVVHGRWEEAFSHGWSLW